MSNKNFVPDCKLERYLLDELPADEIGAIRSLEASDHELRERIAAMRADSAEILERYPPEQTAKRIRNMYLAEAAIPAGKRRTAAVSRAAAVREFAERLLPSRSAVIARAAAACAAVLLAVTLPMIAANISSTEVASAGSDRVKGTVTASAAAIEVWRKEGEGARKLDANSAAREGDVIQLRYVVPRQCYGAVVSVDGRGVFTVHLSGDMGRAAPLTPGGAVALKHSYELDDAPYYEVFYLITASEDFDLDDVKQSLKSVKHPMSGERELSLPQKRSVTAFTLRKLDDIGMNKAH